MSGPKGSYTEKNFGLNAEILHSMKSDNA